MNADELKKADEIVRALRDYASDCDDDEACCQCTFAWVCENLDGNAPKIIASLLESQQAHITELETQLGAEKARYAELQRYNVDCTKACDRQMVEILELREQNAQLAASQRREKAAVDLISKIYDTADDGFCESCREIVNMIDVARSQEAEKGETE